MCIVSGTRDVDVLHSSRSTYNYSVFESAAEESDYYELFWLASIHLNIAAFIYNF